MWGTSTRALAARAVASAPRARRDGARTTRARAGRRAEGHRSSGRAAPTRAFEDGEDSREVFDALFEESASMEADEGHPRAAEVASDDSSEVDLLASAETSPYFNDAFREALAGAQERMRAERRAEKEKIDEEVAVIMQRVRAERAMNAASAKKPEAPPAPTPVEEEEEGRIDAVEERRAPEPTPEPVFDDAPPSMSAELTDALERELVELQRTTRRSIAALKEARAAVNASLENENRQLSRLEMIIDRVRREARYSRAERAVRNKRK
jgi:hypothetical protein